jgi:hypothetical protein
VPCVDRNLEHQLLERNPRSKKKRTVLALSSARQASSDLTTATVPAGTSFPAVSRESCDLLICAKRQTSSSTS